MASKEKDENVLNLDDILLELGQFGKFQLMTYGLIVIPIIFSAIYNGQYIFAAGAVNYRCKVSQCEGANTTYYTSWTSYALPSEDGCNKYAPVDVNGECTADNFNANKLLACNEWVYEEHNTIVSEFNLACQEWKRTLVGTVHSLGLFAALPITGFISDTYGRRIAFVITAVSAGALGLIRSFTTSYVTYVIMEFLEATFGSGVYSTGFILGLELVGLNRRVLGGNLISCSYAIGQVTLGTICWLIPEWRTMTRVVYTPSLLFFVYYFLIRESVRWLLSKGRKEEATKIILKAAKINKVTLSKKVMSTLVDDKAVVVEDTKDGAENITSTMKQVLRSKTILGRLCVCSFWWITTTLVYYGLSINSVSLSGNAYLNYILVSLVEIPGYALSVICLDHIGRKYSIMVAYLVCGGALICLPFISQKLAWLSTVLVLTGKLSVSMAFSSIYIYTSELFPTCLRHSMLGFCSMVGRIGSIVAPQTPLLAKLMAELPFLIFGGFAITAGLLMLLTPETLNATLPDTVEQAETIKGQRKSASKPT